jgi:hypothetical protein
MAENWTIQYLPEKHLLFIKTWGIHSPKESDRLVKEVNAMKLDSEQTRILIDHRDAIIKFRTMEIFNLPQSYRQSELSQRFRVALVFNQIGSDEQFYETVCVNRGYRFSVFMEYDKAMNWLMRPDSQGDFRVSGIPSQSKRGLHS